MLISLSVIILFYLLQSVQSASRYRRCFVCRSRGPLGDCKDQFNRNASNFDDPYATNTKGITTEPCASGWWKDDRGQGRRPP